MKVTLRPATWDDCLRLWRWRNEEKTRAASINTLPIPYSTHKAWLNRALRDPTKSIFIVMAEEGTPIGYVRFHMLDSEAEVSISLDRDWRGKGYGSAAIRLASDQIIASSPVKTIIAYVKENNYRSLKAFWKARFVTKDLTGGIYRLEYTPHESDTSHLRDLVAQE